MGGQYSFFSQKQQLYSCIQSGNLKRVSQLLKNKPHLISQPLSKDNQNTPLTRAIFRRDQQMTRLILGMGADPNITINGITPLMFAAYRDSLRIVQLLLTYQSDHTIKTQQQFDVLDYAILYGNYSIAKFLIDHHNMKPNFSEAEYERIAESKKIYFVNYYNLLMCLKKGYVPEILPNFFEPLDQMHKELITMSKEQYSSNRASFNLSKKRLTTNQCQSTERRVSQQIKQSLLEEINR